MSIEIANESGAKVDEASIVSAARFALDRMSVSPLAELSILLVELGTMSGLHERWMEIEGPTDVLAFPMDELDSARRPDAAESSAALLGDIVLCPAYAKEQARRAGHSLVDELQLLTVHGVLHLLGYDHAEPAEEREMFTLQKRILADFVSARTAADRRAAQRDADEQLLGAVGLADDGGSAGAEAGNSGSGPAGPGQPGPGSAAGQDGAGTERSSHGPPGWTEER